ncbi:hypothetical protein JMUB7540_28290 [Staphylococcus aureus]
MYKRQVEEGSEIVGHNNKETNVVNPVSYTHLTLPTILLV